MKVAPGDYGAGSLVNKGVFSAYFWNRILTFSMPQMVVVQVWQLGLLHKLTRMDDPGVRGRILRDSLVAKTEVELPDGGTMPLNPPTPAKVPPLDFAKAVEDAIVKVLSVPIERTVIDDAVEQLRTVAKEARAVVEESYTTAELDEFTEALTPIFTRARGG